MSIAVAEDSVYLDNEDWRREYVLNDVGKIYIGSHSKPKGRKWIYGQVSGEALAGLSMRNRFRKDAHCGM